MNKNLLTSIQIPRSISNVRVGVKVMALSATFNNISVISWRSALLVEKKSGVAWENHQPPACN
jgi:hypothetical protein